MYVLITASSPHLSTRRDATGDERVKTRKVFQPTAVGVSESFGTEYVGGGYGARVTVQVLLHSYPVNLIRFLLWTWNM